jgi:hypothetical protein
MLVPLTGVRGDMLLDILEGENPYTTKSRFIVDSYPFNSKFEIRQIRRCRGDLVKQDDLIDVNKVYWRYRMTGSRGL